MRLANPVGRHHQSAAGFRPVRNKPVVAVGWFFGFVPEGTPQRSQRNLWGVIEAGLRVSFARLTS
jgi:hypothetical protein